jgi:tetratricopeptide (TPR) repeat protein
LLAFPKFAQPERLAPPGDELGLAPDAGDAAVIATPEFIVAKAREAFRPSFSLKSESARLLGRSLDIGACEGAAARLSADAWALSAMIDVALCKADAGNPQEADDDLARLLDYTPDNYEALVARALVAQSRGRAEEARALFQQALDAAPPLAESEQIVEAIGQL